jgi:hypothetical protein
MALFCANIRTLFLQSNTTTETDVLARVWLAFNKIYFIAPTRHSTLELSRKNIDSNRWKIYAISHKTKKKIVHC